MSELRSRVLKLRTSRRLPFDKWPLSILSHDVWVPNETVVLSPLSRVRQRGDMDSMAKSAVRALDILELLAQTKKPLRAMEIACALGLSASSTHQLLKTMMDSAYLIFEPKSKCYSASIRAAHFGGALAASWFGNGAFDRLVDGILQALDARLIISASQGSFMQMLNAFESDRGTSRAAEGTHKQCKELIGLRVPMFGSCTGAAWLSAQSDDTVLATAHMCRRELAPRALDKAQIVKMVQRIREQGYAFGGVTVDNSRAIALPLPPNHDGHVLVIAISGESVAIASARDDVVQVLHENIARYLTPANGTPLKS